MCIEPFGRAKKQLFFAFSSYTFSKIFSNFEIFFESGSEFCKVLRSQKRARARLDQNFTTRAYAQARLDQKIKGRACARARLDKNLTGEHVLGLSSTSKVSAR